MNWVLIGWGSLAFSVMAFLWLEERSRAREDARSAEDETVMALDELWESPAYGEFRSWA